jgi:hypothetical protein
MLNTMGNELEKFRRKGWHRGQGYFEWRRDHPAGGSFRADLRFKVRYQLRQYGWYWNLCYSVELPNMGPFPNALAAVQAGMAYVERLLADPLWLAADCEAQAERWDAWEKEEIASTRVQIIKTAYALGRADPTIGRTQLTLGELHDIHARLALQEKAQQQTEKELSQQLAANYPGELIDVYGGSQSESWLVVYANGAIRYHVENDGWACFREGLNAQDEWLTLTAVRQRFGTHLANTVAAVMQKFLKGDFSISSTRYGKTTGSF